MNCSPLRGVRAEAYSSPLKPAPQHACRSPPPSPPLSSGGLLDTSLDDEFALHQQHEQQQRTADTYNEGLTPEKNNLDAQQQHSPLFSAAHEQSLSELAAESLSGTLSSAGSSCDDDDDEEEARSAFQLPAPTPIRHTPFQHTPNSTIDHSQQLLPLSPVPNVQLSPPSSLHSTAHFSVHCASEHATPSSAVDDDQLRTYQGQPIDRTMRRNLLAGHADSTAAWHSFRAAATTPLTHTAPSTLLNSLASPVKSVSIKRLESRMAALHVAPAVSPSQHPSYDASAYMAACPSDFLPPACADDSVLQVEESSVEVADDAVEEMGHATSALDNDSDSEDDEHESFSHSTARHSGQHSFFRSPIATGSSTPFISPAAQVAHSQQSPFNEQRIRPASAVQPPLPHPAASVPAPTRSHVVTPMAPASQEWSRPVELNAANQRLQLQRHSRYDLRHQAAEKRRQASVLATASLPKITPPTLEQWQQEQKGAAVKPAVVSAARTRTVTGSQQKMQSGLSLIKSKVAAKRTAAAAATCTTTAAASSTGSTVRPASASTSGIRTAASASTLTTLCRAPLPASLPHSHVHDVNPWTSQRERDLEQLQQQMREQPFSTPAKRRTAGPVHHTPATAAVQSRAPAELDAPDARTGDQPVLHSLPPSLSPPAAVSQTYRALVNGVHVLPPALSWVASHQMTPDRIRDNLRFITTAHACAQEQ